jgi:RNA polymerase sigma-70 factor (ECF subfamily)
MQIDQAIPNVVPAIYRPSRTQQQTDIALLNLIARGDKSAMQTLYCRHRLSIYRFSLRLTGDPTTAEDIVSDVFLNVWRCANEFKARSQVSTWLLAIARNLSFSSWRRRVTEEPIPGTIEHIEDTSDDPEVALSGIERRAILAHCLRQLSAAHREVIDLVYYHEKSVSEVSEIVGIPKATVKTRMHYARKEIADLLAQHQGGTQAQPSKGESPWVEHRQVMRSLTPRPNKLESRDVAKLIRKLRWIGMEREARELQASMNEIPADERGSCLAGPHGTD